MLRTIVLMIGLCGHHYAWFLFIQTSLGVAARINRHKQDVQGKYEVSDFHSSNVNEKVVQ